MKTLNTTGSRQCCLKEKVMLWPLFGPWHVWLFRQELGKCGLGWVKDNKLFSHKKKIQFISSLGGTQKWEMWLPHTPRHSFSFVSRHSASKQSSNGFAEKQSRSDMFMPFFSLANPGSKEIRKILLPFLNYQQRSNLQWQCQHKNSTRLSLLLYVSPLKPWV